MKNSPRAIKILSLVLSILLTFSAGAHDSGKRVDAEQSDWARKVRRIMKWPEGYSVRQEAQRREVAARTALKKEPGSRLYKRDLADALHTLGHMAEEDGEFMVALNYHWESLALFKESGYPTRESWRDGVEHAKEHVFMNLFDQGRKLEGQGDSQGRDTWFEQAYGWTESENILDTVVAQTERFTPRYHLLLKARQQAAKVLSSRAGRALGSLCEYFLKKSG